MMHLPDQVPVESMVLLRPTPNIVLATGQPHNLLVPLKEAYELH